MFVYLLGVLGGAVGIVAALLPEASHGIDLLALTAGPVEELCKPLALIIILDRRPWWVKSREEVVLLVLLAAGLFATLENLLYLHVALPDPPSKLVWYRWIVCTTVHVVCSGIVAMGLAKQWQRMIDSGERLRLGGPFMRHYLVGAGIHAAYNGTVCLLQWRGVLTW